jgi:hypothetical protein
MKYPRPLWIAALALFALANPLRADLIGWTYSWNNSPSSIAADSPGTGSVTLTNEGTRMAAGNSQIVATNLKTISMADAGAPAMLTTGGQYTLTLTLTDKTSGQVGTLSWNGKLSGSFSATSANITNLFTSPMTQTIDLGTNAYTVTLGSYLPPGPPGSKNSGAIGAHVVVSSLAPGGNPGPSGFSPEPSTLLLCSLGFAGCALARLRRRKTDPKAALGE